MGDPLCNNLIVKKLTTGQATGSAEVVKLLFVCISFFAS